MRRKGEKMRKLILSSLIGIVFIKTDYLYSSGPENTEKVIGMKPENMLGVVTQVTIMPVSKDGEIGKIIHKIDYEHNADSGLPLEKSKAMAQAALNRHQREVPKDRETLGLFSSIGSTLVSGLASIIHKIVPTTE